MTFIHFLFSESGDEADDEKERSGVMEPITVDTTSQPIEVPTEKRYVKTLRLTSEELVCYLTSDWFVGCSPVGLVGYYDFQMQLNKKNDAKSVINTIGRNI